MANKKNTFKDPTEKQEMANKIADKSNKVTGIYDGVEDVVSRVTRWFSTLIDKIFMTKKHLAIVSLALACLFYVVVNYSNDSLSSLSSSKTLSNVPVTVRYNSDTFEIGGVPESCSVVLTGDAANVNNAASRSGYCLLSLEGYTEGTHSISVTATGFGDNVSITTTPSVAQVTLKKKTTAQYELSYDFINQNRLDSKYILGTPVFSTGSRINIRASQDTLDSIALVKALIDVSDQSGNFTVDAPLVAYDKNGHVVEAEIVPNSVSVSVDITSPHKTVPITLKFSGNMPDGFALENIQLDHQTTDIYAPDEVLDKTSEVAVNLDLSTLTSESSIILPINLPDGVASSDVTMVNVKASLGLVETKILEDVPIIYRNNDNGLGVSQVSTTVATVTLRGTKSNIENISKNDFSVYIDVAGLSEGTYDLPLYISSSFGVYVDLTAEPASLNITLVSQE